MALGIYIAIVIISILAVVMLKLIRNTSKTSYFGEPNRCQICGRKTSSSVCSFCRTNLKSKK